MENIIVLGDGKLGSEISKQTGWKNISRKSHNLNAEQLIDFSEYRPEETHAVINCIANTDTYSSEKERHWKVNYAFSHNLAEYCAVKEIKLVHISTDYVYAGCSTKPAKESDVPVHAENWYSYTKLLADAAVELASPKNLICRLTHKTWPVRYPSAFDDRISNFFYTDEAATDIVWLLRSDAQGIFNLGGNPSSAYEWLKKENPVIIASKSPAGLPLDTSMDTKKIKEMMMKEKCESIDECAITGSKEKFAYFDLGMFPLVNNLNDDRQSSIECDRYPLCINYYPESGLSALSHAVNGDILFRNYLYKSGINVPYIRHCRKMFRDVSKIAEIRSGDLVIDIGGNDGTLLDAFREESNKDIRLLNIDASENLSKDSIQKGIPTMNAFFGLETARIVSKRDGKARIIASTNVFQHLKDTNSFVMGIKEVLDKDGIWALEFPYWIHDLETLQFDQTYHEHMYYYTVSALKKMMEKHGLRIVRAEEHDIHGGSMRLVMAHSDSSINTDHTVENVLKREEPFDEKYYIGWQESISNHLQACRDKIASIKKEGKKIAGFGAAAKGCIFLNALGLTSEDLEYVVDDTDIKQGKYVPGTGLQVVGREELENNPVDYLIILAHNFADHISVSIRKEYKGKFLVFLPEIAEW
jgi:novobiocin biosynthesis protein NovU/D-mycarose 3-C-methyltransferase